MKTTEQLNGFTVGNPVLAYVFNGDGIGAPGRIVLQTQVDGFCVHWQNRTDGGCSHGGYYDNLADAMADFSERVKIEQTYAARRGEPGTLEAFGDATKNTVFFGDACHVTLA